MDEASADPFEELVAQLESRLRKLTLIPRSTYRLQLNRSFGFTDATRLVPYLAKLGVGHLYLSPYLRAASGSMHGYDVVDQNELNPEIGTAAQLDQLAATLAEHGLAHLLDFVPNHMAIGSENPLWMDVLENGPSSIYAHYFDIDWKPIKEELENRVLLPLLGDQYGAVLERGELKLCYEAGGFHIQYFDRRFPVNPRQYPAILTHRLEELRRELPPGDVHFEDLLSIVTAVEKLPSRSETDPALIAERHREKEAVKRRIVALCEASAPVRAFLEENVRRFNGDPSDPRSFDLLDGLLREQAYRLAYWRVAAEEINYRRFFDINSLAAIRMEDPRVMQRAHGLVFRLIAEGKLQGLRIDHPDGLFSPVDYLARLQEELAVSIGRRLFAERQGLAADGLLPPEIEAQWAELVPRLRERLRQEASRGRRSPLFRPLFVVAEKILSHEERMPLTWAVHGTTGYDIMSTLNGLFVDASNAMAIDELFTRFTGLRLDYRELVYQKRRQTMGDSMSSELNVLARQLNRVSEHDRRTRDFTLNSLRKALIEVIACFPVYRTYLSEGAPADDHDRRFIETAVRQAKRRNPTTSASIFDFIGEVLLGKGGGRRTPEALAERMDFVFKVQQITAPVMAKSVEDTVFYIYNRMVSLNEVGAEPNLFGTSIEAFHAANRERAERWPSSLTATTTHDTKRSEDVRARIDVLSEVPGELKRKLSVWSRLNRRHKSALGEQLAPDRNEEYLLYQTLLGAWPNEPLHGEGLANFVARVQAYMLKATREAKVNTSWVNPDEEWEKAVSSFVAALLDPRRSDRFWREFVPFQRWVARVGALNSLSQLLLKLAVPGVPDLYQGSELWDLSLVDPDNRRPVDFEVRSALLDELDARAGADLPGLVNDLVEHWEDGRIKLYVTSRGLRLRRRLSDLFQRGDYLPLRVDGERADRLVAFARRLGERWVVAMVPRLVTPMAERAPDLAGERAWADTFIEVPFENPGARVGELFTGARLRLGREQGRAGLYAREVFQGFPIALGLPEELLEPAERPTRREAERPTWEGVQAPP